MRRTLRNKILLGYGSGLVAVALIVAWAFASLLRLGEASDAILRENYKSILAAENMIDHLERQDSAALLYLLGFEDQGLQQFRDNEAPFLQWLGRAKDNITIPGEEQIIGRIESGYTDYLARFSELRLPPGSTPSGGAGDYRESVLPAFLSVRKDCVRLRQLNEATMVRASDRARALAARSRWSLASLGAAALLLGLASSLLLSGLLVRPLLGMMAAVRRVAEGDYTVEVPAPSDDELGQLAAEFNAMARKLKAFHDLNIGRIVAEKGKNEAILRSLTDGVVVVDADLKVTNLNPAAAEILGVDAGEARERHFLEVVRNERLFDLVRQAAEDVAAPQVEEGKDILAVVRGETRRDYQFSVTPIVSEAGAKLGVVLLLRDVTRLAELDRLKSEFVMNASHELRTPLTSMGMSISLLLETGAAKLDEGERKLLEATHEDVERLKALASDLLDLSRLETGKMELSLESVSVAQLWQRALAMMTGQAEEKSIQLSARIPEGLPRIRGDGNKLTWVLVNLVSNALRYTKAGGHIRLSAELVGPQVHVTVSDDGAGIPYEYQSRIFDKFVQVKGDPSPGRAGLGLALCREIVRAHGGTIWVESTPGEGSSFIFTLPVAG